VARNADITFSNIKLEADIDEIYSSRQSDNIPAEVMTEDIKEKTGCDTVEELVEYLKNETLSSDAAGKLAGISKDNIKVVDVTALVSTDTGITWVPATEDTFPEEGLDILIQYPEGTNKNDYDFVVSHLIVNGWNNRKPGDIEYPSFTKTDKGLKLHIYSTSPFAIGWEKVKKTVQKPNETTDSDSSDDTDTVTSLTSPTAVSADKSGSGKTGSTTSTSIASTEIAPPVIKTESAAETDKSTTAVTDSASAEISDNVVKEAVEDALTPEVGAAVERADGNSIVIVLAAAVVVLITLIGLLLCRKKKNVSDNV
jgi:hypothetical protein